MGDKKKKEDRTAYLHSEDAMTSIATGFLKKQIFDLAEKINTEAGRCSGMSAQDVLKGSRLEQVNNEITTAMAGNVFEILSE